MSALTYIRSDCYRYTGKSSVGAIIAQSLLSSKFRWHIMFRICQSLYFSGLGVKRLIAKCVWFVFHSKRYQIPYKAKVGYGLYIGHYGPVVMNKTAVVGNNCNFSQCVTIGANDGNAAVIGDNVYIGPNVCVVENVHIGNNVTIGAGAIVVMDIPDNATAAGNPAKVLNYNNPARYIGNKWE